MIDINLLPPKNILSQKEKNLKAALSRSVTVISAVLVLVSAVIFGARFYFKSQLDSRTEKKNQLLADFNKQDQTAQDVRALKEKISGIKIIQSSRTNFASMSGRIEDTLQEATLKSFVMDSDGKITLIVSTDTIGVLEGFIGRITAGQDNPFSKTVLSGLVRDPGGGYSFSVSTQYVFSRKK